MRTARLIDKDTDFTTCIVHTPLWKLGINEIGGHNIVPAGRSEVNKMFKDGWLLLHIYTLKYPEDGV